MLPWPSPCPETKNREGTHKELHLEARVLSPLMPGTDVSEVGAPKDSWRGLCIWGPFALERLEAIWTTTALKMEHCCPA